MSMNFDIKDLEKGIEMLEDKADRAFQMYSETAALKLQNYARIHRPWTDRTAQARKRLTGYVTKKDKVYRINLAHGVDYGVYLEGTNNPKLATGDNQLTGLEAEFKYEKKYAIINPTIKKKSNEVMSGFKNLMDKMR